MKKRRNEFKNEHKFIKSIKKQKTKAMKKITVLLMILSAVFQLNAQGISFEHGTFKEALAKAKAENKKLFMDCYTTWCGPCKMMTKDVFPQKEVGHYLNANFVSIKVDMEKGEGLELAKTYDVKAYPTLLFMDSDGKVVHKFVGSEKAEGFIEQAKTAFDPTKQIANLEKQYQSGKRDLAFVAQYVKALSNSYNLEILEKVTKEIIPTLKTEQYITEDGFTIVSSGGVEYKSKAYNYIVKNKKAFIDKPYIGQESYDYLISNSINNYLQGISAKAKTIEELKNAITETQKDGTSPQQEQIANYYYGQFYLSNKQYDTWFEFNKKAADAAFLKDKKSGLSTYINTAYNIAVNPDLEKAGLYDKAIAMIENIKDADPEFLTVNYCLASLYLKTKNKGKALENVNIYIRKNSDKGVEPDARVLELKTKIESL